MGHHHVDISSFEEQFTFTAAAKRPFLIALVVGIVLTIIGIFVAMNGGEHHAAEAGEHALNLANSGGEHGGGATWVKRLKTNLWVNAVYVLGFSIIGLFFMALQYVSMSGWSAGLRRIPEAFATFIPVASLILFVTYLFVGHDVFHWHHAGLYEVGGAEYDSIIDGKKGYLDSILYFVRMGVMLGGWILFMFFMYKQSGLEDKNGGKKHYYNMVKLSAAFIVFFGVSNSISSWDWILSIDTHWFSTMFGWYHFASYWVMGLAGITLTVIYLKKIGYLKIVNENHIHDYGKYVFAFSIFWTYIWFSQFLLIYYANIPEETIYFLERVNNPLYFKILVTTLLLNFPIPMIWLMTRNSKRKMATLQIACYIILVGHFLDYYLMITPGVMKADGAFGLMEIGLPIVYMSVFALWVGTWLAKRPLVTTKHPMIEECVHHDI
jgi:hypothetical protein